MRKLNFVATSSGVFSRCANLRRALLLGIRGLMCGVTTDPEGMAHVRVSLRNERLCARVGCCGGTRELTLACRCGPGHLYVAECDGDYPPPCRYYAALGNVRGIGIAKVMPHVRIPLQRHLFRGRVRGQCQWCRAHV